MAIAWKLKKVEDRLIKDLKETTLPFRKLGRKYGVSRQSIFGFCHRRGIRRPNRPEIEHTESCPICKSLIRIARKPYSDFISSRTIKDKLDIKKGELYYHLKLLRNKGLISRKFGRLHSKRIEQGYQIYFKGGLPVTSIGEQVGLTNFSSVINKHRALGWKVPDPLFRYDEKKRRKTALKRPQAKRRKINRGG